MASGSYQRKEFVGGAPATTVTGTLSDVAMSFAVGDAAGWPTASTYPFVAVIDRGQPTEEKVLIGATAGLNFTVTTRGYDDTTPVAHASGATIEHGLDASTIDQANRMANLLTAKGDVLAGNGTNLIRVPGTTQVDDGQDGFALVVKNSETAGIKFERPVHVEHAASAPPVAAVPRLWYATASGALLTSDGATWLFTSPLPVVANNAARDSLFGAVPSKAGIACMVGTGRSSQPQVWDGIAWQRIPRLDEAIPKVADEAARNALYPAPVSGDHVFVTSNHQMQEYRVDRWIILNREITVSDTAPAGMRDGDIWLQPVG